MDLMHCFAEWGGRIACGIHRTAYDESDLVLSEPEQLHLAGLSDRKRSEWIASRELLFRIAGLPERTACLYDDFGKPYLPGSDLHISVSHSERWCAAMTGPRPCGVDIQVFTPTVERIAERFLTPDELERADHSADRNHHLHFLWSAKECLYKAYGRRQLGFRENILIPVLPSANAPGLGEIRYRGLHLRYEILQRVLPEAMWVACMLHPGDVGVELAGLQD